MKYLFLTLCSISFGVQATYYDKDEVRSSANDLVGTIDSYWSRDLGDWFQKQEDMRKVRSLTYEFERCADKFWDSDKRSCMKSLQRDVDRFERDLDKFDRNLKINFKIRHFLHTLRAQAGESYGSEVRDCADNLIEAISDCKARSNKDVKQQKKDISEIRLLADSFERCHNKMWDFEKSSCMESLRRDIDRFEKKLDRFKHNPRIAAEIHYFIYKLRTQSL